MKNISILLAVILISTSSYGKGKKYTYFNMTFNHIEFAEITFTLHKKTMDTLQIEGLLKQMTIIDGIPCYGNISFHKDWDLKNFTLADEYTLGKYTFPNPSTHIVTIICAEGTIFEMTVCNLVGEFIMKKELQGGTNQIDISSLSKGMYIIKVTGADCTVQKKLIKE
ncbi:MAG: T9SS type A sorting domain-containing protein [Bacteroidetes bacterium]|nr:T9SS type A sorting domain-containing protein [Bacteroidota bacterium]MBL6942768.1 T9SS type A sorting domain-containing protein [Bacteroidales bacterium]